MQWLTPVSRVATRGQHPRSGNLSLWQSLMITSNGNHVPLHAALTPCLEHGMKQRVDTGKGFRLPNTRQR